MRFIRYITILILTCWLYGCSKPSPLLLDQIKTNGVLKVASFNMATTIYEGPEGLTGFEHDLVQMFANHLDVKVEYVMVDNFSDLLPLVKQRQVHFAAAGLSVTPERQKQVRMGYPYQTITQQIIFRMGFGNKQPKKVEHLYGKMLEVTADTSHEEELKRLRQRYPKLDWTSHSGKEPMELLDYVDKQLIDYTIADSNHFSVVRRHYPNLGWAFNLTEPEEIAWAFPHSDDDSLYREMIAFFRSIKKHGVLDQLIERYFGHVEQLKFVDLVTFKRHYMQRLPQFKELFLKAAEKSGIDWKLLAAVSYQESHWDPDAVSPTGVEGLMMLTKATAKVVRVKDRTDPEESIFGGAKWLAGLLKRNVPKHIPEPDRTWLALAGYNVGFGHVMDAQKLAKGAGKNSEKWIVVKKFLPLLSMKKWYKKTKFGYARGWEPVTYVDNIRGYYDLLVKIEEEEQQELDAQRIPVPELSLPSAL